MPWPFSRHKETVDPLLYTGFPCNVRPHMEPNDSRPDNDRSPDIEIRPLTSQEELAQGVAIQRETWGEDFTEVVPGAILMICQRVGGIAAGAFDRQGRMLGFVFGLTGVRNGRFVHWSHMLAVRPQARGAGLGRRLKLYQREKLLALGVEEVRWTFDPLVAKNAHLNLNLLGVEVERYVPDMYGTNTGSPLHSGLGTDRFVVLWKIADPKVEQVISQGPEAIPGFESAPVVNAATDYAGVPLPVEKELPLEIMVRVEIPEDIQEVRQRSQEEALQWRRSTRRAFLWYQEHGYQVRGFRRDPVTRRCFYAVGREA